ncbi:hypothetical protein C1924_16865 [Stenotrophomonas sp. ESTM1D_MKCIP4_1]|uniref:DUF4123 domain-containing protein n=1 Tax=Stenotrophomonas sp. ESTM1D_MKCIP4_1 TaxID=2072414 RepID=UPI000D53D81C|nr:DUF4123 domain-containing protein [Stenotrophomonas sp. ESTM1D_MKCIP4_1]AWH54731.1 hypothetical protein C1924_16865 [Stenotrophomonas sp. ESTM1D_MKCIP4_1]
MSVESLCEKLIGTDRSSAGQCHLLMQPTVERCEMDEAFDALLESVGIAPVPIAIRQIPVAQWPSLIPLDLSKGMHSVLSGEAVAMAMAQRSAAWLLAGRPQRACAWVWTRLLTRQLARQLAERAVAHCPHAQGRKRWLRFYDPMVTDLFLQCSSRSQRAYRFEGVTTWLFLDRWAEWAVSNTVAPAVPGDPAVPWPEVESIGALNQAWIRALQAGTPPDRVTFAQVQRSVAEGRRCGVSSGTDLDLFATHGLSIGPYFHRHSTIQTLLAQVGQGERYGELVRRIGDKEWQDIRIGASAHAGAIKGDGSHAAR